MAKRQITIEILPDGTIKLNNAGNPDESRIISELEELAAILTGSESGYEVEQHVHTHATAHAHDHGHQHAGH